MLNVIIFTDYGSNTGLGHLTRCIALYEAFQHLNCNVKLIINGNDSIPKVLSGINYCILQWTTGINGLRDGWDIAVVDSYVPGEDLLLTIANDFPVAAFFDDTNRTKYPPGIVINGAIFAEEISYPVLPKVLYLLGVQYAPLRKIFLESKKKKIEDEIGRVLITIGGGDSNNLSPLLIDSFRKNFPSLMIDLMVGSNFGHLADIKKRVNDHVNLIFDADSSVVHQAMVQADLAISGAGQTLYELAVMGVPTIAIKVADNQENNIKGWLRAGFIEFAGMYDDPKLMGNVIDCYYRLRNRKERQLRSETGQKWMAADGADKLAKSITRTCFDKNLMLRKSSTSDMHAVYELSNDPEVRANSYHDGPIALEDHEQWFMNKINDEKCLFLIAEINGKFIGQVRFEIDRVAVISISIHKSFRRAGISQLVMAKALLLLKNHYPATGNVFAYVKDKNIISKKYFERCGFNFLRPAMIHNTPSAEYIYRF